MHCTGFPSGVQRAEQRTEDDCVGDGRNKTQKDINRKVPFINMLARRHFWSTLAMFDGLFGVPSWKMAMAVLLPLLMCWKVDYPHPPPEWQLTPSA
jgi:hypothetical protein